MGQPPNMKYSEDHYGAATKHEVQCDQYMSSPRITLSRTRMLLRVDSFQVAWPFTPEGPFAGLLTAAGCSAARGRGSSTTAPGRDGSEGHAGAAAAGAAEPTSDSKLRIPS